MDPQYEEATPLLTASQLALPNARKATSNNIELTNNLYPYAIFFIFGLAFVADAGGSLVDTPEVRMLEMAVCRDYYRTYNPAVVGEPPLSYVDEKLCKLNEIQADLAYIRAAKSMIMTIPGILLTLPYGRLADKIGRKPVVFLGMLGQVLAYLWTILVCYFHQTFPTRLVLVAPLFLAIGGGSRVLTAIMSTIIVDVAPDEKRTTMFYVVNAGLLVTEIVGAPIGSWLLSRDLWLPFKFSVPILLIGFPLILAMPETLRFSKSANVDNDLARSLATVGRASQKQGFMSLAGRWLNDCKATIGSLKPLFMHNEIALCLLMVFLSTFANMSDTLFVQYTSKRLRWSISTTGYIIAVKSMVILCTLISLAGVMQLIEQKTEMRPLYLDVCVVRLSLAALTVGAILMAASREAALLIIGSVLTSVGASVTQTLQGLLAKFADTSSTGQLYASVALLELVAQLTGSFAFALLFDVGLCITPLWGIGLPFYCSGVLNFMVTILSFLLPTVAEA